ncbi:MAG: MerR family transcriptional regulator [Paraburkholderia sp.]|uniref:MerR family transcriptional regulator n=1 Tax=Paraburkholderia sp. TaxID=1926495 RepID=UPI0011FEF9C9|nr:MerR family transcriptional regulator [Paraburkholderia sp.]TAL94538.1 MAG: MerR family transcriptional regulator [Paraburkholderia sp.]
MPSEESPNLLTVRDAAKHLNVTPRTLKYYEERGLVTPTRSEGRYRLYDDDDLERFARILRFRALGFSLQGITEMLKRPLESVEGGRNRYSTQSLLEIRDALAQRVDALNARIDSARRELKEVQNLKAELGDDLDYVQRRLAGESADALLAQRNAARLKKKARTPSDAAARLSKKAPPGDDAA